MARRMSNRARVQRMQEEKKIEAEEKKKKRAAPKKKKATAKRSRAKKKAAPAARMKVVWSVGEPGKEPKSTFPFPEKAEAEKEAERLTAKHGKTFLVKRDRVEME